MGGFFKFLAIVIIIALLVGVVGIIYKFTNGFNEDFKTFFVEYNGEMFLTANSKLALEHSKVHTFNVKYTFDNSKSEAKGYKVSIVPNVTEDFDFTVDGEVNCYSGISDLSEVFKLKKEESSFDVVVMAMLKLDSALERLYKDSTVVVPEDAAKTNPYPYKLVVSSYNDSVVLQIDFKVVTSEGTDIEDVEPAPPLPDAPIVKPETPKHRISYRLQEMSGFSAGVWVNPSSEDNTRNDVVVRGETEAPVGKRVWFDVYTDFIGQMSDYYIVKAAKFTSGQNEVYCQFSWQECKFYFDMPDHDVTIKIVLEYTEDPEPEIVIQPLEWYVTGCDNSEITVDCPQTAAVGNTVTITVSNLAEGVELLGVTCSGNSTTITVTSVGNGVYTFTMPDCRVSVHISAKFTPTDNATYYNIYYTTQGSGSDNCIELNCPIRAKEGERIVFTISVLDMSDYYDDFVFLDVSNVIICTDADCLELDWTIQDDKYVFTMPNDDVTITVYLEQSENQERPAEIYVGNFHSTWTMSGATHESDLVATNDSVDLPGYWNPTAQVVYVEKPIIEVTDWMTQRHFEANDIGKMVYIYTANAGYELNTSGYPTCMMFYVISEDAWYVMHQPNTTVTKKFVRV